MRIPIVVLGLLACSGPPASSGSVDRARVKTLSGPIVGEHQEDLVIFRGVPYAAPPVGELRWRAPEPPPSWTEERDAKTFGSACPQNFAALGDPGPRAEDCLTLNLWAHDDDQTRPVMVWIHGGGYTIGTSRDPMYEASLLARDTDTVVVSLNYRLGALGFMASEGLAAETPTSTAGNYGLSDQILALQWVQDNAAAFGGDPDRVTVFGESAGGGSVCALMAAPGAAGLLHRGVVQSGGGCYGFEPLRGPGSVMEHSAAVVEAMGCQDDPSCMRALSVDAVLDAQAVVEEPLARMADMRPNLDGQILPGDYWDLRGGDAPDLPVLIGANADEMALFLLATAMDQAAWNDLVSSYGDLAPDLADLYPVTDDDEARDAYIALESDVRFICPAWAFAEHAGGIGEPTWMYHFDHFPDGGELLGAAHAVELLYLFGNAHDLEVPFQIDPAADDLSMGAHLRAAWGAFAHGASPSPPDAWPPYTSEDPQIGWFTEPLQVSDDFRDGRCAALRDLGLVP